MWRLASFSSKLVLAVITIALCVLAMGSAQSSPALKYDKTSEVKVKGQVDAVRTADDNLVHIMLKSDKGALDVVVAPEKFLKDMEISFNKGDDLEVLGSQLTVNGTPLLLAREITRGGNVMLMRDGQGAPVWIGWPK